MGVVDIDGGTVRQACGQFHATAHTGQASQPVERVAHSQTLGEGGGQQCVVRLKPARQR
jgi:hypothetical protein